MWKNLFGIGVNLVGIFIDITTFLILIHWLRRWWPTRTLVVLDQAAQPLIDELIHCVDWVRDQWGASTPRSTDQKLVIVFFVLMVIRLWVVPMGIVIL
jgi:hypothetical protein